MFIPIENKKLPVFWRDKNRAKGRRVLIDLVLRVATFFLEIKKSCGTGPEFPLINASKGN